MISRRLPGYHAWRGEPKAGKYKDIPGFCKAAKLEEIAGHRHVLTPGRYVGAADVEEDDLPFEERFAALKAKLEGHFAEANKVTATKQSSRRLSSMGDWRTATVTELQRDGILLVEDGNHGEYRPRPDEFVDRGVAFIRAADMDAGRVLFESAAKINERAKKRIAKGIGAPGDVLLSHKGTVGKLALVPDEAPPFVCSPQTTFWRTRNEPRLDRKYLYAFLRSPGFHEQLATRAGETDMAPYVSLTSQRGLSIIFTPIEEQRAIAQILGALDDKIDLNRRTNETLEGIVRAIFKDWFVDFGPTRGRPRAFLCTSHRSYGRFSQSSR
jgi:Type I restriction modification DNA specificity domain